MRSSAGVLDDGFVAKADPCIVTLDLIELLGAMFF